jgi:hypothetical protein
LFTLDAAQKTNINTYKAHRIGKAKLTIYMQSISESENAYQVYVCVVKERERAGKSDQLTFEM